MKGKRIKELEQQIMDYKYLYYQGTPAISDFHYDQLEEELRALSPDHPLLKMVGTTGLAGKETEKIMHASKMLSLNKTYLQEELISWINGHPVLGLFKIDGVSCSLVYSQGKLIQAKTRGDGIEGENILSKVLWIASIPKIIPFHEADYSMIEVRGEVFCDEENFACLAEQMEKLSMSRPSSPRNIVAGIFSRKENHFLARFLRFSAFDLLGITKSLEFITEEQKLHQLRKLDFFVQDFKILKSSEQIANYLLHAKEFIEDGDYLIDGIVFVYNELTLHRELGETTHHPRFKIAFKFQGEVASTMIEDIQWQVSRNGVLTPIAVVTPIILSGALIKRVSLHNFGMVMQHQLKKGDCIEIIRSGEVIPKFLRVLLPAADAKMEPPDHCPSCGHKVEKRAIRLICSNSQCTGRIQEGILHFIKKIKIEDFSEKRLQEAINLGIIRQISDLYRLTYEDLQKLPKIKDKLATKIIQSIQKSKITNLPTFLSALGISGGASNRCEKIAQYCNFSLQDVMNLTVENLIAMEGLAEKTAASFLQDLREKIPLINELLSVGFTFENTGQRTTKLAGKSFCITGTLSQSRNVIEKLIGDNGGILSNSVSKNTSFLVANSFSDSSKYQKAQKLQIPIITEVELLKMIEQEILNDE